MQTVNVLIAQIANDKAYAAQQSAVVRNDILDTYVEAHYAALAAHYETQDECEIFEALKEDVDVAAGICIIL